MLKEGIVGTVLLVVIFLSLCLVAIHNKNNPIAHWLQDRFYKPQTTSFGTSHITPESKPADKRTAGKQPQKKKHTESEGEVDKRPVPPTRQNGVTHFWSPANRRAQESVGPTTVYSEYKGNMGNSNIHFRICKEYHSVSSPFKNDVYVHFRGHSSRKGKTHLKAAYRLPIGGKKCSYWIKADTSSWRGGESFWSELMIVSPARCHGVYRWFCETDSACGYCFYLQIEDMTRTFR